MIKLNINKFSVGWLLDNLPYKIVSLFIAIILWITILGRRDFVHTQLVEVDFLTPPNLVVSGRTDSKIEVRLNGSRSAIKRLAEKLDHIVVDLGDRKPGSHEVSINPWNFELPQGVRIMSIRPPVIRLEKKKKN